MTDRWDRGLPERTSMQIPDPIRPYLALIRVALWCLLAGGLSVTSCRHGAAGARADAAKAVADAREAAADNLSAANACGQALSDVSAETRLAEQRAAEWKAAADAAATNASRATAAAQAKADSAAKALQAAKAKPTCASQLAMTLCPEIPIL